MIDLLSLSQMEDEDSELVPEILPVDARLSIVGSAQIIVSMLQSALEVVPAKEIIPNTGFILVEGVEATESHISYLRVSSTDGERSIALLNDSIGIKLPGSVLIPGKRLLTILKLVGDGIVRIDVVGTSATIRSGRVVWTVSTPPVDHSLPSFSSVENLEFHTLDAKTLLRSLELVYPAISKSSSRQSLMQVDLSHSAMIACDGVRAHKIRIDSIPSTVKTTIPLRFIETAIKELRSFGEGTVEFGTDKSTVAVNFGKNVLMSQRLNFSYPDVNHLILGPALSNEETLEFDVAELTDTVKRVRVNSDPDFYAIFLSLRTTTGGTTLTVRARDKAGNSSQESFPVNYTGKSPRELVVNHRHLLDYLSCLTSERATFKLGESTKTKQAPIYVEDETFVGSLMPMAANVVN